MSWQYPRSTRALLVLSAVPAVAWLLACTPTAGGPDGGGGATGGTTGGTTAAGGSNAASGGAGPSAGGAGGVVSGSGGAPAGGAGGAVAPASGGASGSGGASAGGGSGGASAAATGGSGGSAAPTPDASGGSGDLAGDGVPAPLMECPKPSIDRLTYFGATGEGTTVPMSGSLLVKEGDHYVAKEQFIGSEWHVLEILTGPSFNASKADLTMSRGVWLTYNSTGPLFMQMRPASKYGGGGQFATMIPSTAGETKQAFFSFEAKNWAGVPGLGNPTLTYPETINQVRGLLLVGRTPNVITISQMRIDGYTPACQ